MKLLFKLIVITCIFSVLLPGSNSLAGLKGPYFGQKAPEIRAEILLDGIICTPEAPQMCAGFGSEGELFLFGRLSGERWRIYQTRMTNHGWTVPKAVGFADDRYIDRDFTLSPDGQIIYFGSNRPIGKNDRAEKGLHLFYAEQHGNGWHEPKPLDPIVNEFGGNYPSVAANGNIYFFRCRETRIGKCDLFISRLKAGIYQKPICLDRNINSTKHDWDCYIAPDESYIIFSSKDREDTHGGQDLYIAYRKKRNRWTRAVNMGPRVNSSSGEICPAVTIDGKYFLFTSRRRGMADIYWIDASIIDALRKRS